MPTMASQETWQMRPGRDRGLQHTPTVAPSRLALRSKNQNKIKNQK